MDWWPSDHPQEKKTGTLATFTPFLWPFPQKNTCHESLAGPVDDTRIRDLSFFPTTPVNVKKVKKTPAVFLGGKKNINMLELRNLSGLTISVYRMKSMIINDHYTHLFDNMFRWI